jgi:hypothetical protein
MQIRYEEAQMISEHGETRMGYEVYGNETKYGFITPLSHGWLCFAESGKRFTASTRRQAAIALIGAFEVPAE